MPMTVANTRVTFEPDWGLWVKHEEDSCPSGPHFSKTRGVLAHIQNRVRSDRPKVFGVLDTYHSQGGWAVARACHELNQQCVLYYPVRRAQINEARKATGLTQHLTTEEELQLAFVLPQQHQAGQLGARLVPLPAGRSSVLFHQARQHLQQVHGDNSYMMPNALKLPEMVRETAREVELTYQHWTQPTSPELIIISASSGTIAAGVIDGVVRHTTWNCQFVVHLGYSRTPSQVLQYMSSLAPAVSTLYRRGDILIVDEVYAYGDEARIISNGDQPPWPCNKYYDLKAALWWKRTGREHFAGRRALLWNIG